MIFNELIHIVVAVTLGSFFGYYFYRYEHRNSKKNEPSIIIQKEPEPPVDSTYLSFEQCNEIIDDIMMDIWKNKYFLAYRLKETVIIANMDSEISTFVDEVYHGIGAKVKIECLRYYSYEYLVQRITRKAQMLFIEYTQTYKPNTK